MNPLSPIGAGGTGEVYVVDRGDLVVDEAGREAEVPDSIAVEVGRDPRRFLGQRYGRFSRSTSAASSRITLGFCEP